MASVQKETGPGLSCCCLKTKVNNNSQTYQFDKLSYFLFQDSASEVSYACGRII